MRVDFMRRSLIVAIFLTGLMILVGYSSFSEIPIVDEEEQLTEPKVSSFSSTPCFVGYYSSTGYEPCTAASAGYYVSTNLSTSQTACSAGTYQNQDGQTSCKTASAGYYVSGSASTSQTACCVPPGP